MRLCVLGLGRLGLPWALAADAAGHDVRGFDVDAPLVQRINERQVLTREPGVEALLRDPNCDLIATTNAAEALDGAELSVVSVPTPSQADGSFGLAAVLAAVEVIGAHAGRLPRSHLVVLKSTVSPGATDGKVRIALDQASARSAALAPEIVYVPEFHAIGSVLHDIAHPYLVIVGGRAKWALERAADLHRSLAEKPVPVAQLDATGAELAKLASNCFRTMKIAYANALAELCVAYGSDPGAVCAAVGSDPHIGAGYLTPGLPYGGPCYPRDNPALRSAAASVGIPALLPQAIEAANERRFAELEQAGLAGPIGRIGIVGMGFKEGVDELEGSPALQLASRWRSAGREVLIYDPLVRLGDASATTSLRELLASSETVLLGAPSAELLAELTSELELCESPPRILDPWGALSATGRTAEPA